METFHSHYITLKDFSGKVSVKARRDTQKDRDEDREKEKEGETGTAAAGVRKLLPWQR